MVMAAPWRWTRAKASGEANSSHDGGEFGEIGHHQIGLMRGLAERPPASVDERGPHAIGFCPDTVEGVIGDEENAGGVLPDDLGSPGVGLPMRLEIASLLDRDDMIERKADVRPGGLEHVAIAVRENRQRVS